MFQRKVKLAQTAEGFEKQAETFLSRNGFPIDGAHKKLFAAFIQHLPEDNDFFNPERLARVMRKAKANELAFYLMHPERRPVQADEETSEQDAAKEANGPVVSEA